MSDGLPPEVQAVFSQAESPLQAEPEPRPATAPPPYPYWLAPVEPIASLVITEDTLIARGPTLFWGLQNRPSAAWSLTLRDGVNASGPARYEAGAPTSYVYSFLPARPLLFRNGLFADLGSGLTSVTILYEPLREEQLVPRPEAPAETE